MLLFSSRVRHRGSRKIETAMVVDHYANIGRFCSFATLSRRPTRNRPLQVERLISR
jgi:hypothetical protein